jgi:hypothetical protein
MCGKNFGFTLGITGQKSIDSSVLFIPPMLQEYHYSDKALFSDAELTCCLQMLGNEFVMIGSF